MKKIYVCQTCSFEARKWHGKCPSCNDWNSLEEELQDQKKSKSNKHKSELAEFDIRPISLIPSENFLRYLTMIKEFDRVLGGGIAKGSLTLLGGQPGIGKSTLLMQACGQLAKLHPCKKILYISGEESVAQIADRARRMGISNENIIILNERTLENIKIILSKLKPTFLIIDSIQTTYSQEIQSIPGSINQVREVTYQLMNETKAQEISTFVIGHINKEGSLAGPKTLEHMVDTVIYFEGEKSGDLRTLRAIKNRFGPTSEIGLFMMNKEGLSQVLNPSEILMSDHHEEVSGRAISCVNEGSRVLLVEVQSLVIENKFSSGRRISQGYDVTRLSMLVAIIEKNLEIPLATFDIYTNIIGEVKIKARDLDLAIIASILSSYKKIILPRKSIFIGEVGLAGEIRKVKNFKDRAKELSSFGYEELISSNKNEGDIEGIQLKKMGKIESLISITG